MKHLRLTDPAQLLLLPDGTVLTVPGDEPIVWLHAYTRPHPDPDTGLWRLPRNPFAEYDLTEIEAALPDRPTHPQLGVIRGDEDWLSTLDDPRDTTER